MAVILAFGNSDGVRRCDSKCHDATKLKCNCLCGGRYHGKGSRAEPLLESDILTGDAENLGLTRFLPEKQLPLPY